MKQARNAKESPARWNKHWKRVRIATGCGLWLALILLCVLYRDRLTVGEHTFPLHDLRGIGLIQRQGMVFSTADADYAITARRLRCVRKYQTLFEILKRNR